jgi:hypothetical protein
MISTSEVRITCVIEEAQLQAALDALHGAFELERPDPVDAVAVASTSGAAPSGAAPSGAAPS